MIDINTALQNILKANYGKDVRQSIHDAIYQIDGNANEAVDLASIKFGTAVTGPTSPVGTYKNGTVYFNTSTGIIWKLSGGVWVQQGSMKAISSISKTGTAGDTDTYTISYNDGTSTTYQVKNGTQGVSITNITAGTKIGNTQHYDINLSDGTTTPNGFDVVNGTDGSNGVSISDITLKTTVGSTKNYAVKLSDGTEAPTQFAVNDGVSNYVHIRYSASFDGTNMVSQPSKDHPYIGFCVTTTSVAPTDPTVYSWVKFIGDSGSGTGDMKKSDFVTTYPGTSIVDKAAALWDGSTEISGTDMMKISTYASNGATGTVDKSAQLVDTVNGKTADSAVLAKFSYSQGLRYDGSLLGTGDMKKSEFASNGQAGKVDYALQATIAATAGAASNIKTTGGTVISADTISTKISALDYESTDANKVLKVNASGTGTEWGEVSGVPEGNEDWLRSKNLFNMNDRFDGSYALTPADNIKTFYIDVKPNTTYTLSYDSTATTVPTMHIIPSSSRETNPSTTSGIITVYSSPKTFTTGSNINVISIQANIDGVSIFPLNIVDDIKLQVEEGATATTYVYYNKSNADLTPNYIEFTMPANATDNTATVTSEVLKNANDSDMLEFFYELTLKSGSTEDYEKLTLASYKLGTGEDLGKLTITTVETLTVPVKVRVKLTKL